MLLMLKSYDAYKEKVGTSMITVTKDNSGDVLRENASMLDVIGAAVNAFSLGELEALELNPKKLRQQAEQIVNTRCLDCMRYSCPDCCFDMAMDERRDADERAGCYS